MSRVSMPQDGVRHDEGLSTTLQRRAAKRPRPGDGPLLLPSAARRLRQRFQHPVSATSTSPGIVLEDGSLEVTGNRCQATGTVRNHTPDKILAGIEVTAFNAQGSAVAAALADGFTLERDGRAVFASFGEPLRPGQSGFFHSLLVGPEGGLRSCNGIARIELTGVTFR